MSYTATIQRQDDLDEFRDAARRLLAARIAPQHVAWSTGTAGTLFSQQPPSESRGINVPRSFADLAASVICYRDEQKFSLLYQALWRIDQGENRLMEQSSDRLLYRLRRMAAAVRHDQHRMTAFVRFRQTADATDPVYIAWYQPRHLVLRRTAGFFVERFANMRFSILTPDLSLHWDRNEKHFTQGVPRTAAASPDTVEDWWRRYYAAIFNPNRLNPRLMQSHMPKHFWRDLPEASSIRDLIEQAGPRTL